MRKIIFFVMMGVFLGALGMPAVTYSEQKTLTVTFYANDIGRVISSPSGIDCTRGSCSAKFEANTTVTLTVTPIDADSQVTLTHDAARERGNHFVGWKYKEKGFKEEYFTSPELTLLNVQDAEIEAVFKIERCFGAVGAGCGLTEDDSFNSWSKTYDPYGPDTDSDIAVGSILHDICCYNNPDGFKCGFGDSQPDLCRDEWDKAVDNKCNYRSWLPDPSPFGRYEANRGDSPDLPYTLKAPDGTRLDIGDESYCESGEFCQTFTRTNPEVLAFCATSQGVTQHRDIGYGICGQKISPSFAANPSKGYVSEDEPLTVNLEAQLCEGTDTGNYKYSWISSDNQKAEGRTASMKFTEPGKYYITLTITDSIYPILSAQKYEYQYRSEPQEITIEKKLNKGSSWGDTHLCTFDGLAYDFQAVGEFVFVKSTVPNDSFEVQVRLVPWGSRTDVSVNQAAAMNVSGDKVGFYSGKNPLCYINGSPQELTDSDDFILPEGGRINRNGQTYTVTWPDESAAVEISGSVSLISVYVSDSYKKQITGLLGNLDGDPKNDIATRNGVNLGTELKFDVLYPGYADSWRISREESLFDYASGETTETFTDYNFPQILANVDSLSAEVRAEAEQICREAGITNPVFLENCILDVGLTGDESFAQLPQDLADPEMKLSECMPGDPDGSGKTDIFDALLIAEYDAGLKSEYDIICFSAGDSDCNGKTDIFDALKIAEFDTGLSDITLGCSTKQRTVYFLKVTSGITPAIKP